MNTEKIKISILYVYYNTPNEIINSISTIKNVIGDFSYEIIIVDNASKKSLPQKIAKDKFIRIIKNAINLGYGKALNQGAKIASGEFLLLVNSDTQFFPRSLELLVKKGDSDSRIGIVGPQVLDVKGKILQSISDVPFLPDSLFVFSFLRNIFPFSKYVERYHRDDLDRIKMHEVNTVGGACMLMRKSLFNKINGFDEQFFMYFEEADLCYRAKKAGYKIIYLPSARIIHMVGRSSTDKEWIKKTFEKSRFLFFKKYHGLLSAIAAEAFVRFFTVNPLLLSMILCVSAFLNLYKINQLMMFFGDFGRDYLAARDMLLTGNIPLVGIPSSVVWLHQGPLSIYLIALAFKIGNFHPVGPAILYGIIGVASTFLVYWAGKTYFNRTTGLFASAFFATSPLVIVNARMPYHTAPIPFFALLFFLVLFKVIKGNTVLLPLLFFLLGVLFQFELSNAVLFFLLFIAWFIYKPKLQKLDIVKSIIGFLLGIATFVLYDITHSFVQTFGFVLWVVNRIRLFFGLTLSGNSTTVHLSDALNTIFDQVRRAIFPQSVIVVFIILVTIVWINRNGFQKDKRHSPLLLTLFWVVIPLIGFSVHAEPGTAYFPLIFPPIGLIVGYGFYKLFAISKMVALVCFVILIIMQGFYIVKNEYFMDTSRQLGSKVRGWNYGLGPAFAKRNAAVDFIVKDAGNKEFSISGGGLLSEFKTSVDNYIYLAWWKKAKVAKNAQLTYILYERKGDISNYRDIIYENGFIYITKWMK